jgi:hypothetical protein
MQGSKHGSKPCIKLFDGKGQMIQIYVRPKKSLFDKEMLEVREKI